MIEKGFQSEAKRDFERGFQNDAVLGEKKKGWTTSFAYRNKDTVSE